MTPPPAAEKHECPIHNEYCPNQSGRESESFFLKNFATWISILLALGGWAYTLGSHSNRLANIETQVRVVEEKGSSTAQEAKWTNDEQNKKISTFESDLRNTNFSLSDIKTDLKIIKEWVIEQKLKQKAVSPTKLHDATDAVTTTASTRRL
jgi:hypothetical protein